MKSHKNQLDNDQIIWLTTYKGQRTLQHELPQKSTAFPVERGNNFKEENTMKRVSADVYRSQQLQPGQKLRAHHHHGHRRSRLFDRFRAWRRHRNAAAGDFPLHGKLPYAAILKVRR